MPIINKPVKPHINAPYRGKLVEAGGLRIPEDWHRVIVHYKSNAKHLICHDQHYEDSIVVEIHDAMSKDGTEELENCRMESFELTPTQRYDLAIYLLSTITVQGR